MMQRIVQSLCLLLVSVFSLTLLAAAPLVAADTAQNDVCQGIEGTVSTGGCTTPNNVSSVSSVVKTAINVLSYIVGIISVIMVIVGGLQYVLSNGDSGKMSNARNTITYALIGVAITAMAQVLVQFVLTKVGS